MNATPCYLLIAEDEAAHVEAVRRAFEQVGTKVEIRNVTTLRGYRASVAERVPDLAVVDLNLPDGQALEVLTYPPEDAPFPILVMTAFGSQAIVVDVMKAGALDYIVKSPEAFAAMSHTVERALREWALRQKHKQAEATLMDEAVRRRVLFEQCRDGIVVMDQNGKVCDANCRYAEMLGYSAEEVRQLHIWDWDTQWTREQLLGMLQSIDATGPFVETRHRRKDGSIYDVEISSSVACVGGLTFIFCVCRDITARKRAEIQHDKLEVQLRQAQKMEAVGRLAGGVAHDFNNMLQIILGCTELVMNATAADDPRRDDLTEAISAARRSADLTRQLLAFARKQTISPRVLDLNDAVDDILKMLRRLIGEDIDLLWQPAAGLWLVNLDPSQLDQILANLAINARDAIAGVGKLTIETGKAEIDEAYCQAHPDAIPGAYVMLAVSDTGCGMDKETQARIFEPFFTTKELGKGTGLGLATVYGIVRQNNGFITVYSEPGKGTTFGIYLPRHAALADETETAPRPANIATGTETVLLAEDEAPLLYLARRTLEGLGYTVLAAAGPGEALRLAAEFPGEIHLLLTDVVMPGMSGRDLRDRLSATRPAMKCLFMSGYTANAIAHRGVLDKGLHFLQKPFSRQVFATKLREVLGGENGEQGRSCVG